MSLYVLLRVSINIECRRAWLQSAGSYQRGVNIFCVFFLRCRADKEMGDGPAVAERLAQVTGCPSTAVAARSPANLTPFYTRFSLLYIFLNGLLPLYQTVYYIAFE